MTQLHAILDSFDSSIGAFFLQKPLEILTLPVFIISLVVGSFLNVVIYRTCCQYNPGKYQGTLTVSEPKRSFCPECLATLKWYENIPLFSYILLGGKCGHCRVRIPVQYPAVEAITAILLVIAWTHTPNIASFLIAFIFITALISATVIDIKTLKIPNKLTIGGACLILLLSPLSSIDMPAAATHSFLGLLTGAGITFLIVEAGKLLFGRKNIKLKESQAFIWDGQNMTFTIQEDGKTLEESEVIKAEELFTRPKDFIQITGKVTEHIQEDGKNEEVVSDSIKLIAKDLPQHKITGWAKEICVPQEAMGMGDVKLMGLIGAAMGSVDSLHVLTWAAIGGAVYGITLRLVALAKKEAAPNLIAFGPWISAAGIVLYLLEIFKK
jgi:leader peptidase (prepilin peptidase) / N-methyltransferase